MAELKKYLMKHVWRIQQIGALGSLIMLSMTIALILYPMVKWRFAWLVDDTITYDWLVILILWLLVIGMVLLGGFIYDRLFRMWIPQQRVAVERNPFAKNLMTPKEVINWQYCWIPLLKKNGLDKETEFMLKWNEHIMNEDPDLRKEVYRIIKWVQSYKLPPPDKRYLQEDLLSIDFDITSIVREAAKHSKAHENLEKGLELK